ncbi:MAG: M28 family peptidase [Flavobacteriales bacterium]
MKYTLLVSLFFAVLACNVSKTTYKIKKDKQVIKYANSITAEELKQHLSIIASDEYEGRETGKKGQRMTATYLQNEFKKDGIAPGNKGSYLQNFPLQETAPPSSTISISGQTYEFAKDFYFFSALTKLKPFQEKKSNIIDVGYGINDDKRNDYQKLTVKGKTVIISTDKIESHPTWDWRKKLKVAKEQGAKSVFFTSTNFSTNLLKLDHYLTGSSMKLVSDTKDKKKEEFNFLFISDELKSTLLKGSRNADKNDAYINTDDDIIQFDVKSNSKIITTSNVLGFIEGSDKNLKNEVVVLTAHYDHLGVIEGEVYNGADDDGTGTVALLELAEAFQKAKNEGNGPKRSILIMPVSGEEKGLLGSRYYSENPVYPLSNTVVDLNIDMIGRLDKNHKKPNYVYLIGADKISKELHDVSEAANKTYSKLDLDYTFNDENDPNRFYYRSDHYNFAKKGIPVIFYFSGVHEDYHKATDEIDKIMFDKVERITKLVFYTAWEIANKPTRLKID